MPEDEFELDSETKNYVDRLVSGLDINPDFADSFADSTTVFYKQYEKSLGREIGEDIRKKIVATASLYASGRINGTPFTFDELIAISGEEISRKELSRAYNRLVGKLELNIPPARPQDFIERFCRKMYLDEDFQKEVIKILEQAESLGYDYSGRIPEGVAAGAIYLVGTISKDGTSKRTLDEFKRYLGLSDITISTRAREIAEKLGFEPYYPFVQKERLFH